MVKKVYERGTSNVMSRETIKENKNNKISNNESLLSCVLFTIEYLFVNFGANFDGASLLSENKANVSNVR